MSKADNLRNSIRQTTAVTEENKEKQQLAHQSLLSRERSNEPTNVPTNVKVERRRFSFDLRPELHRQLKMQCLIDDSNMYEVVETIIENYLASKRSGQ